MPKPNKNANKMREIPEDEAFEMKFQAEMQVGFEESRAQAGRGHLLPDFAVHERHQDLIPQHETFSTTIQPPYSSAKG